MEVRDIKYSGSWTEEAKLEFLKLIDQVQSLKELISSWKIYDQRYINIFQAIDDDTPDIEIIGIELKYTKDDFVEFYITKELLEKSDGTIKSISKYITGFDEDNNIELDDDALFKWDNSHGFIYSQALCNELGRKEALMPYVLLFALSDGGEITINSLRDSEIEDMKEDLDHENLNPNKLLVVHANYYAPKAVNGTIPGFGCSRYILMD